MLFCRPYLLITGALPFWDAIRRHQGFRSALQGINAAVVGLLLAALYSPVWTSAIKGPADVRLAIVALGMPMLWKLPPWLVVVAAVGGIVVAALSRHIP